MQLLAPLLWALLFLPPSGAALLLALGACAAFLAHEPLLVLLGRRGRRIYEAVAGRARVRVAVLGSVAAACAWTVARLGSDYVRLVMLVPALLCALTAGLVLLHRERTILGELVSAAALTSFCMPLLAIARASLSSTLSFGVGWLLIHIMATLTARAYVHRKRGEGRLLGYWAAGSIAVFALAGVLSARGVVAWSFGLAPLPFVVAAVALAVGRFAPRTPKTLGWTLAAANLWALLFFGLSARTMI